MRLLSALVAALLAPLVGLFVASIPFWHAFGLRDPSEAIQAGLRCLNYGGTEAPVAEMCGLLNEFSYLGLASLAVGGLGLLLILVVQLAASFTGFSRFLISLTFPSVTFIALVFAGVIALGQAGLLAGSIYLLESYFLGTIHLYLIGVVAISGAAVGLGVLWRALHMFRSAESHVIGMPLDKASAPSLHGLVDAVSERFATRRPDNIIVGFDPTFFATSAKIHTPVDSRPLQGETLYLSLPLLRMLSAEEVTSIIGHELAHFSGSDTIYSKRFAPAYRGLYSAMHDLAQSDNGARGLLAIPVRVVVQFVLSSFEPAEKKISRARELRADELGAQAGSPESLSSALVKLSVLTAIWNAEFQEMIARVRQGRFTRNMSINFVERAKYDVDQDKAAGFVAEGLDAETAHPTDTHPITRLRIQNLGLDPAVFIEPETFKRSLRPLKLIVAPTDGIDGVEEKLTDLYQQIVVRRFGVDRSDATRSEAVFANLLCMFLARMAVADGKVEDAEIRIAQEEARKHIGSFDATMFREFCRHPDSIADLEKLVTWGNLALTPEGACRLKDVLKAIALADGDYNEAEQRLFETLDRDLIGSAPEQARAKAKSLAEERV
jgi:Zn-dependent protease with chaperone function